MRPRLGVNVLPNGRILGGDQEVVTLVATPTLNRAKLEMVVEVGFKKDPNKLFRWEDVLAGK